MANELVPADSIRRIITGRETVEEIRLLWDGQLASRHLQLRLLSRYAPAHSSRNSEMHASIKMILDYSRTRPAAVRRVMLFPGVGAWLAKTLKRACDRKVYRDFKSSASPELLPLSFELAYAGSVAASIGLLGDRDFDVLVPAINRRVLLPVIGQVHLPLTEGRPQLVRMRRHGTSVDFRIRGSRQAGWSRSDGMTWTFNGQLRPWTTGDPDSPIIMDYTDRYISEELRIMGMDRHERTRETDLARSVTDGCRFLEAVNRQAADVIQHIFTTLIPLRRAELCYLSSTSKFLLGGLAMSLPANPVTMAESLVHESQHFKLFALAQFCPLIRDEARLLPSPWKGDLRPSFALMQGCYAFCAVIEFLTEASKQGLFADPKAIAVRFSEASVAIGELHKSNSATELGDRLVSALQDRMEVCRPSVEDIAGARVISALLREVRASLSQESS